MGLGPQLSVRIETRHDVASIALGGELDMATVPILEDHLAHLEGDEAVVAFTLSTKHGIAPRQTGID